MSARREKAKAKMQQPQAVVSGKNTNVVTAKKRQGHWKENLGKYLLDVSKYVLTGVVIASLFKSLTDYLLIYILGVITVLITLITGLILTNYKED